MFIRDNFKLLFIHPPKTGGISVGTFLLDNGFQYTQEHLSEELKKEYMKYGNHHVDSSLIPDINYDYIFSIFRDPVERLISGYFYRFSDQMSFNDFVNFGFKTYDSKSCKLIDQIIKPQVNYYTKNCDVLLFENLHFLPTYLRSKGISVSNDLKHLNKSTKKNIEISSKILEKIKKFYHEDYFFLQDKLCGSNT